MRSLTLIVVGIEPLADDLRQSRPQALRPVRRIVVEALAVLAAEAAFLGRHRLDELLLAQD